MNNQFIEGKYDKQEIIDNSKFEELAKDFPNLFHAGKATGSGTCFDRINFMVDSGTTVCELKSRAYKSSDCFIEVEKFQNLMNLYWNYGILPFYINFYENEIYMWELDRLADRDLKLYLNVEIKPKDAPAFWGNRFGLPFKSAYRFVKNEEGKWILDYKPVFKKKRIKEYTICNEETILNVLENEINKYNYKNICRTINPE